jgi:hypothetical protein
MVGSLVVRPPSPEDICALESVREPVSIAPKTARDLPVSNEFSAHSRAHFRTASTQSRQAP